MNWISERVGSASKTYHADSLGSTRGLTDGSQAVTDTVERDAFGMVVASTGSTATPFGFVGGQGYYGDADSGLMLLGARYYDRTVGRFISRDPLGYGGGDVNVYRYCGNDPVNGSDPTGTMTLGGFFGAVGGVLLVCAVVANPVADMLIVGAVVGAWIGSTVIEGSDPATASEDALEVGAIGCVGAAVIGSVPPGIGHWGRVRRRPSRCRWKDRDQYWRRRRNSWSDKRKW